MALGFDCAAGSFQGVIYKQSIACLTACRDAQDGLGGVAGNCSVDPGRHRVTAQQCSNRQHCGGSSGSAAWCYVLRNGFCAINCSACGLVRWLCAGLERRSPPRPWCRTRACWAALGPQRSPCWFHPGASSAGTTRRRGQALQRHRPEIILSHKPHVEDPCLAVPIRLPTFAALHFVFACST